MEQLDTTRPTTDHADATAVAPTAVPDDTTPTASRTIPAGGPDNTSTEKLTRSLQGPSTPTSPCST